MTDPTPEENRPVSQDPTEEITETNETIEPRRRRWPWILLGVLVLLIGAGAGSLFGYQTGMAMRLDAEGDQLASEASHQYDLAVQDMNAGKLENALRRLEYVISLDPDFPGAKEKLTELMIAQQLSSTPSTPTPEPTPTVAPTPDTRSEQQLFDEALRLMAGGDWGGALQTLDALRNANIDYRPVDVDGLYYISLMKRGEQKILVDGSLENGIYDLTLAEKIGPLDADAVNYRKWARMYLTAASYWDVDWEKVVVYFADIYPALPSLHDSSGITATERYRKGLIGYGIWLMEQERWCDAEAQLNAALAFAEDPQARMSLDEATKECHPPTDEPMPEVPTATVGTVEPTVGPTVETTVAPTTPVETPVVTEVTPPADATAVPDGGSPGDSGDAGQD